jgi:UDP-N-acetylmuramoyl-L-alanyl-D-glutamate--2,6-diaminopimelate ligase
MNSLSAALGDTLGAQKVERPAVPSGPYVVVGLGRAGCSAADALASVAAGERVIAWDCASAGRVRGEARRLRRHGIDVRLGGDGLSALDAAGVGATVIKSPGIDPNIALLRCARQRGLDVLDELELGWRLTRGPIVGVTGTNGKSTTSKLLVEVLAAAGQKAQLAGNTDFGVPLSAAAGMDRRIAGAEDWIVCEVSSFQLETTLAFLPEIAVFTNLTPEHLARHHSMGSYGATKQRMFVRGEHVAPVAVINFDDGFGRQLAGDVAAAGGRVLSYGFAPDADVRIERADWNMRQAWLSLRTPDGGVELTTGLPGAYNARNVAGAFAVGHVLGLSSARIAEALDGIAPPPGRWEILTEYERFDVIVDFAHNPDGIRQLLETARALTSARDGAALRTVLGATGAQHSQKAREVGGIARALSDHLILTTGTLTGDPGDPRLVRLGELRRAASSGGALEVVLDRRAAIERALTVARPGDVVVVLGIGALSHLVLDASGTTCPFDDRQAVRESLHRAKRASRAEALA